jgi:Fe-S cluster assembly iron-binding protein IscA
MQLTETAAARVKELLQEEGKPEVALRVAAQPGGCCGFQYSMLLTDGVSDRAPERASGVVRPLSDGSNGPKRGPPRWQGPEVPTQ